MILVFYPIKDLTLKSMKGVLRERERERRGVGGLPSGLVPRKWCHNNSTEVLHGTRFAHGGGLGIDTCLPNFIYRERGAVCVWGGEREGNGMFSAYTRASRHGDTGPLLLPALCKGILGFTVRNVTLVKI